MRTYRHSGTLFVNGKQKKPDNGIISLTDEEVKSLPFQLGYKLLVENGCEIESLDNKKVSYRMSQPSEDLLFLLKSTYKGYSDFEKVG